jgi:hypothetical protein
MSRRSLLPALQAMQRWWQALDAIIMEPKVQLVASARTDPDDADSAPPGIRLAGAILARCGVKVAVAGTVGKNRTNWLGDAPRRRGLSDHDGANARWSEGQPTAKWSGLGSAQPSHVVAPSSARRPMEADPRHPSVLAVLQSTSLTGCIHNRSKSSAVLPKTPCREGVVHT